MKLYLDCEFNGFGGDLISLALVSECGRYEFYEVLQCHNPVPWVAENVIPILGKPPIANRRRLTGELFFYLNQFDAIHVVADWPEDIAYFCRALLTDPGERIGTPPLTMEVVRISSTSTIPHNALEDARGIRAALAKDCK